MPSVQCGVAVAKHFYFSAATLQNNLRDSSRSGSTPPSSSSSKKSVVVVPSGTSRYTPRAIACRATSSSSSSSPRRRSRMIALHGKGGDGPSFERYMQPLVEATSHEWDWIFLTGPHDDGSSGGQGRAWWKLPPGVRTFEAESLEGVEESLAMVEEEWPFDGIMGFSQGAMLGAVVCGRGLKGGMRRPSVAIIAGAAWPTARGDDVNRLREVEWAAAEAEDVAVPEAIAALVPPPPPLVTSVHTVDTMNPPVQARRVAEAFGYGAELLEHKGGHVVPLDEKAIATYVRIMGVGAK